jgi:GGDEF domain-containing protein
MDKPVRKRGDSLMRKLADQIETELQNQEVCAVYNSELARVWPKTISAPKRKQAIERFAEKHRLAVTFYDIGLCAIFEKPHQASSHTVVLPLKPKPIVRTRGKKPS